MLWFAYVNLKVVDSVFLLLVIWSCHVCVASILGTQFILFYFKNWDLLIVWIKRLDYWLKKFSLG